MELDCYRRRRFMLVEAAVAVRRDVTNGNRVHDEMGVREAMGPWVCMMADPPEQRQLTPPKNGCGLMAVATR